MRSNLDFNCAVTKGKSIYFSCITHGQKKTNFEELKDKDVLFLKGNARRTGKYWKPMAKATPIDK